MNGETAVWAGSLESPEVLERFKRDYVERLLPAEPVPGLIRPANAWMVMSALQLALAHPHFPASIRPTVEGFARQLQELVSLTPALAYVAEAGWHRDADVLSGEEQGAGEEGQAGGDQPDRPGGRRRRPVEGRDGEQQHGDGQQDGPHGERHGT